MEKKITKKEMFAKLREKVADDVALVKFIDHEIELLERKNSSKSNKPTATQIANEQTKENILAFLSDNGKATVTTIMKAVGLESNQKCSALVRQLKESGLVERTVEKGGQACMVYVFGYRCLCAAVWFRFAGLSEFWVL